MIPTVPDVFALPVSHVHVKLALVVAILQQKSTIAVLITLRPVPFVEIAGIERNAVTKAVALVRQITPLAFIEVTCCGLGQLPKRTFVEVHERDRAIVECFKALV